MEVIDVARALVAEKQERPIIPPPIPSITNLGDVEPQEVQFLWPPYIPYGKLTILEGDPGLGKTFFSLFLCSAISTGGLLPDQEGQPSIKINKGRVLFMTAEDGLADTVVPRLQKMGADRSMIHCLTGWKRAEDEKEMAFTLRDLNVLKIALEEIKPVLVVIDPLQAYIGDKIDMHRANETRPLLSNLSKLAEIFGCSVLAIRHISKGGSKALYRGIGSIDFAAAARSILTVGQEPITKQKAMAHIKSSCAENGVTLNFEIHPDFGFGWSGVSSFTAEDLLASPSLKHNQENDGKNSRLIEAIEFLYELLSFKPLEVSEIRAQAKKAGISFRTLERAKTQLGFKSYREGERWYWPKLLTESTPEEILDGGFGGLVVEPDITGSVGRPPTPPSEKYDGVEGDTYLVGCTKRSSNRGLNTYIGG